MKVKEISKEMKSTTITVEGYVSKKEENKDGKKAVLFSIRDGEEILYFRIKEDADLWSLATKIQNGEKVTVTGELKTLKGVDNDKITYLSPDEIETEKVSVQSVSKQLYKIEAKNAFVEFMADAFNIDKLKINFATYDATKASGSRITNNITVYLELSKARALCNKILKGTIDKAIEEEKEKKAKDSKYYPQPVYQVLGGVPAETLAIRGQKRPDGKSLSRSFIIEASTSNNYAFTMTATSGPGTTSSTGLIIPEPKNIEKTIRIPVTRDAAEELALCLKDNISAFTNAQYK